MGQGLRLADDSLARPLLYEESAELLDDAASGLEGSSSGQLPPNAPLRQLLLRLLRVLPGRKSRAERSHGLKADLPHGSSFLSIDERLQRGPPHPSRLAAAARSVLRNVLRASRVVGRLMGPKGPGLNDTRFSERIFNVATSLPMLAIGMYTSRVRTTPLGKHFGNCFTAVGATAAIYHSSSSPLRPWLRKLDYWSIGHTSAVLRRAAGLQLPGAAGLMLVGILPFKPSLVSTANLAMVEGCYLSAALADRSLMARFLRHLAITLGAGACFKLDDLMLGRGLPYFHSAWHVLAAASIAGTNGLLRHREQLMAGVAR